MLVSPPKYRYIGLLDVDAFFAQAEQVLDPSIRGKPVVVLQSTEYGDGQVIACSYEAKGLGVKRGMTKKEVTAFNGVNIRKMPLSSHSNSSDRTKYEMESVKIFSTIKEAAGSTVIEKASIDEMYLDMTEHVNEVMKNGLKGFIENVMKKGNIFDRCFLSSAEDEEQTMETGKISLMERFTRAVDEDDNETIAFFVAFFEAYRLRMLIKEKTNYETSVGVSYSKKIAKYVCKRHRPFAMTMMLPEQFCNVYGKAKITEITGFGGILGRQLVDRFNLQTINDLDDASDYRLYEHFTIDEVKKIRKIANGSLDDEVKARSRNADASCSKTLRKGTQDWNEIMKNLIGIAKDLHSKLKYEKEQCKRVPTNFALYYSLGVDNESTAMKRKTLIMNGVDYENYLPKIGLECLKQLIPDFGVTKIFVLGLTASKFEDTSSRVPITAFFSKISDNRKRKLDIENGWNATLKKESIKSVNKVLMTKKKNNTVDNNISSEICEIVISDNENIDEDEGQSLDESSVDCSDDDIQIIGFVNCKVDDSKKKKVSVRNKTTKSSNVKITKGNNIQKGRSSISFYMNKL
uniref:DNA polymerase eta (inferred by orthology to a human protein) n=1 Tax=Strongyloides venezuelensis TaxID=75913 RepID=A0A0K0F2W9_STRVS